LAGATKAFEAKFRDKTVNAWASRGSFKKHEGKYMLLEMDESGDADSSAPLGKLSVSQIEKGQKVLDELEKVLEMKSRPPNQVNSLSSQFFSLIPTDIGRKHTSAITTLDQLKEKQELLKFYLRMGFEECGGKDDTKKTPISGVMSLPLPPTLAVACPASATSTACSRLFLLASSSRRSNLAVHANS